MSFVGRLGKPFPFGFFKFFGQELVEGGVQGVRKQENIRLGADKILISSIEKPVYGRRGNL